MHNTPKTISAKALTLVLAATLVAAGALAFTEKEARDDLDLFEVISQAGAFDLAGLVDDVALGDHDGLAARGELVRREFQHRRADGIHDLDGRAKRHGREIDADRIARVIGAENKLRRREDEDGPKPRAAVVTDGGRDLDIVLDDQDRAFVRCHWVSWSLR